MNSLADPTLFTAALAAGFTLGLRHALDPDHIVAVSTLSVRQREYTAILRLALWWGAGHTLTVGVAALVLVGMKSVVSPSTELVLEALVGIMLVMLGIRLATRMSPRTARAQDIRTRSQSFVIGAVHGLAGSAAVLLVAAAAIETAAGVLLFVLVFGVGSVVGMLLFTGLIGIPLHVFGDSTGFNRFFGVLAAIASVSVGAFVLISSMKELIR